MSDFSTVDVPAAGVAPLRPVAGLGAVAAVFIALTGAAELLAGWCAWHAYETLRDFVDGKAERVDVEAADGLTSTVGYLAAGVQTIAGITFLAWLWRARGNSESLSFAAHRHGRGWTIGGWFCPVVNLWFPQRIVTDIWRTSRPDTADVADIERLPGSRLVTTWWVLFLLSSLFTRYVTSVEIGKAATVDELQAGVRDLLVADVAQIVAAVLIVLIIKRINDWQNLGRAAGNETTYRRTEGW